MSEHTPEPVADTGLPEVDQVLATMAESADMPLADQVQVLEDGHAALRRALG